MKILMVCLGNICRSPMAEGVMKHLLKKHGLNHWFVDSAGTGDWHVGDLPDHRAIKCTKNHGIDITDQRARHFKIKDLDHFDHVFVMDSMNLRDITRMAKTIEQKQKIKLLMDIKYPGEEKIVPDPYYTDLFEESYQLIYKGCEAILLEIGGGD